MKRFAVFAIPFAVIVAAGIGTISYLKQGPDLSAPPVDVEWKELDALDGPGMVRVKGMAHYTATVKQEIPGSLMRDPQSYWLYAFYAPYDTDSRAIRVMVRTDRQPEDMVSYELITITGYLSRATPEKVSYQAEVIFGKQSDYFFTDEMLLLEPTAFEPYEGEQ